MSDDKRRGANLRRLQAVVSLSVLVSNHLKTDQRSIGHAVEALKREDKRAFHAWDVPLRLEHLLYRMRAACHLRFPGIILLMLDPVQYKLWPHSQWDRAITLRRKPTLWLVRGGLYRKRHLSNLLPLPGPSVGGLDDGTLAHWARSYHVLAPRLTYRRGESGWSGTGILKFARTAERKALAAVRCRRMVMPLLSGFRRRWHNAQTVVEPELGRRDLHWEERAGHDVRHSITNGMGRP